MLLLLCAILTPLTVHAGPVFPRAADTGNNSDQKETFSATTWIPIIVVGVVLTILSVLACSRKSLRRHIASMGHGAAIAAGAPPSRELTADQLAGSINRAPGAPPRRARRPRRTPSQISTVSLPAYMKEPGDQELVVSRGPDGEDVAMPEASADDDDDDDDRTADDTHGNNINLNPPPRAYSPMPHLPTDSPLLVGETTPDPRGDAPAYFEAVQQDDNTVLHHSISINDYPPGIPAPSLAPPRGFFASIFSSQPPPIPSTSTSTSPLALAHTRTNSSSLTTAPLLPRPPPLHLLLHPLLPRAQEILRIPPRLALRRHARRLLHIARKHLAPPPTHPLQDRLKAISGTREGGVGRFGVPFGEAAVRYAASANASRVDLGEDLPPGWEDIAGSSGVGEGSGSGVSEGSRILDPAQIPVPPSPTGERRASGAPSPSTPDSRDVLSTPDRRASGNSVQSFVTAPEHGDDDDSDGDGGGGSVIRIRVQEPTDGTVRPEEHHAPAA
ncbi:hypothetical protein C8J57DRAFT_1704981 [Mycena rebaudengoi]|nr:hypothetical protein C8J57DRAFT_1704981 [Mycena rebaudengoi]